MRFLITTLALATLGFAGACASSAGTNNPRVVVMPIAGSDSANDAVKMVVDKRYDLVSGKKYKRAASRLDATSKGSKDVRRVSRKLDIDAVVTGELVKKGRKKYELRLVLRAGESGKEFDSVTVKLKSKRLAKKDVRKVRKKLYSALSVVDSWNTTGDDDENDTSSRSRRSGSDSSKREMERARKMRLSKHDKEREDEDRRAERDAERDAKRDKKDRKRAEKERRKAEKLARRRADKEDEDEDFDEDDDSDRDSGKKSKKKSKKRKKDNDELVEVVTVRDESGQALDEEDPF